MSARLAAMAAAVVVAAVAVVGLGPTSAVAAPATTSAGVLGVTRARPAVGASTVPVGASAGGCDLLAPACGLLTAHPTVSTPTVDTKNLTAYAVFWNPGSLGTYSATYKSLMAQFFTDLSGATLMNVVQQYTDCLLYTSPSPRDGLLSRMPSSA